MRREEGDLFLLLLSRISQKQKVIEEDFDTTLVNFLIGCLM